MIEAETLKSIAAPLMTSTSVSVDGNRYLSALRVGST